MKLRLFLISIAFAFILSSNAMAAPSFSNPLPTNGSYVFGRDTDLFSVNITDALLNTATAKFHIRVDDPTSIWANVSLSCSNSTLSSWNCNTTVSGLSALVKDGDTLLYYFDAYNTNNEYGSLASISDPVKVIVDRSFPRISILSPNNNTYARGNITVVIDTSDKFSGVNSSAVKYSLDNVTFNYTTTLSDGKYYSTSPLDTATWTNNQTVRIHAIASDLVENKNYSSATIFIDNEKPTMSSLSPASNQVLTGTYVFYFNAEDAHSGLNHSTASFQLAGANNSMNCFSSACNKSFDTKAVADGSHSLNFFIRDNATNIANSSVNIIIDNLPPSISITSPSGGQTVQGNILVAATVTDAGIGVKFVQFKWQQSSSSGNWVNMQCSGNSCTYTFDTSSLSGEFDIVVRAYDNLDQQSNSSVKVKTSTQGGGSGQTTTTVQPGTSGTQPPGSSGISPKATTTSTLSPNQACGNNVCEVTESCSNCEIDCGKCSAFDLPNILSNIFNNPFFQSDEGKIILFTGILSGIAVLYLVLRKVLQKKKPYEYQ